MLDTLFSDILFALRRIIARKGRVSTFYYNNGTNFVGAAKEIFHMNYPLLREVYSLNLVLQMSLITTVNVRLVLSSFKKIGDEILSFDEIYTFLTLMGSLLN